MTGNKYFLDSSTVIDLFYGKGSLVDKLNFSDEFFISAIVLGELYIGVNRVKNKQKHLQLLLDFLTFVDILYIDSHTAELFGEISAELYSKGKPIPTNDVWIASSVKQYDLVLVTGDKHFDLIDDLSIQNW